MFGLDPSAALVADDPASFTILIGDTPYGAWAAATVGVGGLTDPALDGDGDGFLNLEEHAWGTDGGDASSFPSPGFSVVGGALRVAAPVSLVPADVTAVGETSADLKIWTTVGVTEETDGFSVLASGEALRFLRVRYTLEESSP
jgi:hypothetical protein